VITCVAVASGCAECTRRRKCDGDCGDLCHSIADLVSTDEGHKAWHAQGVCRRCGAARDDAEGNSLEVWRPCSAGRCNQHHCPNCDVLLWSDGPLGCRCTSNWLDRLLMRPLSWLDRLIHREVPTDV
jgi:hypothetical protein